MNEEIKWKELYIRDSNSGKYFKLCDVTDIATPNKPISPMRKIEEGFDVDLKCSYNDYKNMAKLLGIKLTLWKRLKLLISRKYK